MSTPRQRLHLTSIWFFSLALALVFHQSWLSAQTATRDQDELVSQAETFRKRQEGLPPQPEEKPQIVLEEEKKAPEQPEGPVFFVKKIKLEGNTLFSDKDFEPLVSQFENHDTTFGNLRSLAQLITNHYRANGFSTSRAYIPPQKVRDDMITIKVIEGKVSEVYIQDKKYFSDKFYEDFLIMRKDRIFRYQDLEQSLYALNRNPNITAKAYLIAGKELATSDIILKTQETAPFRAYYEFSNSGSVLTHRARHTYHINHDSLFGRGDRLALTLTQAEQRAILAGAAQYSFPIEKLGITLSVSTSYVESALVKHLRTSEIEGKSWSVVPGITKTFIRNLKYTLDGFVGLEVKDSKTTIGGPKSAFDRMRVLRAGPRLSVQDRYGRTIIASDVHWGIKDFLGSSDKQDFNASRHRSGGEFVYYTGSLTRINRLPYESFMVFRATGQWTHQNLTSVEQFRAGGAFSVRGHPESEALGDAGLNASLELNFPPPIVPDNWTIPYLNKPLSRAVRFITFFDLGTTYMIKRVPETELDDRLLMGTGWGLRVDLDRYFTLQMDYGIPLGNDNSSDKNRNQIHLSVTSGF